MQDRQKIGVSLAESGFNGQFTIAEVKKILAKMYPEFDETWFMRECRELRLPEGKQLKEFSNGMKAKLRVLTALSHKAQLLILDEPTAGLDAKERIRFRNVISSLAADKIVILATHIVTDIAYVAKTVVLMNGGKIIKTGTQEELCSDISGKVWEITAESDKVMEYMSRMRVSNAVSDGSKYTLRIVSDNLPEQGAKTVQPTLEDVCIYYFGDM